MDIERDVYGLATDPAQRMQEVMLSFYDLQADAGDADFSSDLIAELRLLRSKFIEEFERKFPGYGEGRAVWR